VAQDGLLVDRRAFISIGAAGAAALVSSGSWAMEGGDFPALMAALEQLGDQLPATGAAAQNAYVYRLAALAMLNRDFPAGRTGAIGPTGVQIGPLATTQPPTDRVHGIALVGYRMAPGALLQAHNHPNYSVATIGIEGEARVSHYEPDETAPPMSSRDSFTVRRTAERLLRAGEASTLAPARDNIHTFRAGPQGARFVDLFSIHGPDIGFSYLEIEPRPLIGGGDAFQARWSGNRPSNA
jgi:hypothetical protein